RPLLWAEDATLATGAWHATDGRRLPPARAGAPHRGRRPPHPYAVAATDLADALGAPADGATAADLWLPTVAGVPVGSPELSREVPGPDGRPRLRRWRVPALELTPEQALELSGRLADRPSGDSATAPSGEAARAPSGDSATAPPARGGAAPGATGRPPVARA